MEELLLSADLLLSSFRFASPPRSFVLLLPFSGEYLIKCARLLGQWFGCLIDFMDTEDVVLLQGEPHQWVLGRRSRLHIVVISLPGMRRKNENTSMATCIC